MNKSKTKALFDGRGWILLACADCKRPSDCEKKNACAALSKVGTRP